MKKVKLTEEQINKAINEISYGAVDGASDASENIFDEMSMAFNDFYDTVNYNENVENPYVKKIKKYADAIYEILMKKNKQRDSFNKELNKFDYKKFYADKNRPDNEEDYDGLDLKYLQNKYPKNNA